MILKMSEKEIAQDLMSLDELKASIINHICNDDKVFFKSQQINEPELCYDEKHQIASNLLTRSPVKFLQRFGFHILKDHLRYFESQQDSSESEICDYLRNIKHSLEHQGVQVKNRRYAAMLKMIMDGNYFSENEMKSRDPLLYEQLIGQYQSADEKRANLRPNAETSTLVDILLQGIDRQHDNETEQKQRENEDEESQDGEVMNDDEDSSSSDSNSHQQWGNFDDEKKDKKPKPTRKRKVEMITASERDLLKEEFLGIMYSNFLSGKDQEHFDYTTVDTNSDYDNVNENDQDEEDKYFEGSDDDLENAETIENVNDNEGSDDDLDIYMKHLETQIKNQQNTFQEEFDED